MEELKPCPFCGENLIYEHGWYTHPETTDCLLGTGFGGVIEPISIPKESITLWNRRAAE